MAENKEQETKKVASTEARVETKPTAAKTVEVAVSKEQTSSSNPRQNNSNGNNNNRNAQGNRKQNNRRNNGGRRNQRGKFQRRPQEFEERVVDIARVTNVVKGGRRFSFSTLVVIGDKKGRVAYGHGKAKEVPDSIKKAIKDAKRNLIKTPIVDKRTIPHITQAKFISSNVLLKPAPKGKGIIASGAVRAVVELAGYHDIVTKSLGSSNKANTVKATIEALKLLKTTKEIASLRNKDDSHFK